jgi:hypothetical protein
MNLATLIVEGEQSALGDLRKALPLQIAASWEKGDIRRNGKPHASPGFSATIADAANPRELAHAVQTFLKQCKERGVSFPKSGVSAELSLGVTVGDSQQFVAGVEFSPLALSLFAEQGLALSITAYPTSDDANVVRRAT